MEKKRSYGSKNQKPKYKKRTNKSDQAFQKEKETKSASPNSAETRLNKYIANTGLCSRREADEYILAGHIMVNGQKTTELGTKISAKDVVTFKGKKLASEKKVYILLNKPKDIITTTKDPQGRKTVFSIIKSRPEERFYPVGPLLRRLLVTFPRGRHKNLNQPYPEQLASRLYHRRRPLPHRAVLFAELL